VWAVLLRIWRVAPRSEQVQEQQALQPLRVQVLGAEPEPELEEPGLEEPGQLQVLTAESGLALAQE
jgi:hypothetical protein